MAFHVNTSGFISSDGRRRFSPVADAGEPDAGLVPTGLIHQSRGSAGPLGAPRGLVAHARDNRRRTQATRTRHTSAPLTPRGLTK